MVKKSFKKKF